MHMYKEKYKNTFNGFSIAGFKMNLCFTVIKNVIKAIFSNNMLSYPRENCYSSVIHVVVKMQ